jgi:hypothetical protein
MYALNLQAMSRTLCATSTPSSASHSPTLCEFPREESNIAMRSLMSSLVTEVSKSSRKDSSLPPSFITSFLQKVFPAELECVDFPQALTALDYLKDIDNRRRKEQANALKHLGIDRSVLDHVDTSEELANYYPGCADFLRDLPRREKRADVLYTQLYVALRRWVSSFLYLLYNSCSLFTRFSSMR